MRNRPDDSPTLAEQMNRGLGLDPAFRLDKPGVLGKLREETDATVKRAQANVDQQRANDADVERIASEMEQAAGGPAAPSAEKP